MATTSQVEMSATLRPAPMPPEDPERHKTGLRAGFASNITHSHQSHQSGPIKDIEANWGSLLTARHVQPHWRQVRTVTRANAPLLLSLQLSGRPGPRVAGGRKSRLATCRQALYSGGRFPGPRCSRADSAPRGG